MFDRTPVLIDEIEEHAMQHPAHAGHAAHPGGAPHAAHLSHSPANGLRLTRRGRLVVLLALVTLLLAAFSLGRVGSEAAPAGPAAQGSAAQGSAAQGGAPSQTVVKPGETLWAVAKRVAPGHDPRNVVLRLQELNDLEGGMVRAGQLLVLPR